MTAKKRQYAAIDIARYISALLVVAIHVYPFYDISETFNTYFIADICRLAVPFFFVVSAFFFFKKWGKPDENLYHLKRYLWRLARIYLIWTVIYLPYTLWNYASVGFSIGGLLGWIRDFFLNGSYYHLWFLPAMMLGMVIVYYLFEKKGMVFTLKVTLALYIIGYIINIYGPLWASLPGISIVYGFFTKTLVTARDGIFFAPLYLALGLMLARTRRVNWKGCTVALALSMILLWIETAIYGHFGLLQDTTSMFLMLVPATFFLVDLLLVVRLPWKPVYGQLRKDSLLIYASHILFARLFLMILPNSHLADYFFTLACAQTLAYLVVKYEDRWPILRQLV